MDRKIKLAIDYRKYYTNYLIKSIGQKLEELKRINDMPDNLIEEYYIVGNINCYKPPNKEASQNYPEGEE